MKWVIDSDGDIGITFWGILTLIKYKHSTIWYWFKKFEPAPKYVNFKAEA